MKMKNITREISVRSTMLIRLIPVLFVASTCLLSAKGDDNSIDNLGRTYLAEDGKLHAAITGSETLVLELDRDYALLGLKIKGVQGYAGYVLSPPDGNSAANIMFGTPKFPASSEELMKSPGFTKFSTRVIETNGKKVSWRQWSDSAHLYSDTDMYIPVANGLPEQKELVHIGIVANFTERRKALEDHLVQLKAVDSQSLQKKTTLLLTALNRLPLNRTKWQMIEYSDNEIRWLNEGYDEVCCALEDDTKAKLYFSDIKELRQYWRTLAKKSGGGIVEAEIVASEKGSAKHTMLMAKYPLSNLGWAYQSVALFPTEYGVLRFEVRSRETGTTGIREAVGIIVYMKESQISDMKKAAESFRRDPYESEYDHDACFTVSDQPKWDERFPEHPLTHCRKEMAKYVAAIESAKFTQASK
jgi:hypothetical protein